MYDLIEIKFKLIIFKKNSKVAGWEQVPKSAH